MADLSDTEDTALAIEGHAREHEKRVAGGVMASVVSAETRAYLKGLRDAARMVRGEHVPLPSEP